MNIGSIVETLLVDYVQPKNLTYFSIFVVASSILFSGCVLFFLGWKYYIHVQPYDSVVIHCIPVVVNAFQSRRRYKKDQRRINNDQMTASTSNLVHNIHRDTEQAVEESTGTDRRTPTFLDFAKVVQNGKYQDRIVNDVKLFRTAIILSIILFPYKVIYSQVS